MDYKPINLDYVAVMLNEIVGGNFYIEVNSVAQIRDDNKIACSLQASREPFPMDNIASETIQLTLYAYLNVDTVQLKSQYENELAKLLGARKGTIETLDEPKQTYSFNLFFGEMQPATDPASDSGYDYCTYVLNGSILVTNESARGGVLCNDVTFELSTEETFAVDCKTELAVITYEENPTIVNEGSVDLIDNMVWTHLQADVYTLVLNGYMLNDNVHKILGDIFAKTQANNTPFYLRKNKDGNEIYKKKVKLINGNVSGQSGAFEQYVCTLQEVK